MTRTKILFISLMLLSILPFRVCYSSDNPTQNRFGIKGGINFANFHSSRNSINTSITTGFNLGLFSKLRITKKLAFQPELYYTREGAEVTYNNIFANGTARFNLNYIELPLLIVVNLTENFNLHFGPYGSFLVSGTTDNRSNIGVFNFHDNINTSNYNRFDAGLVAGAGVDIGAVGFGARFNYGMTKIGKERSFLGINYTYPDASNAVINVYVSLALN